MTEKIKGGFYLKARKIQESWIMHAPPHVREIWDWLLMHANWSDSQVCKRGQLLTSYKDIQEGTHWMVGWRKEKYSKNDCETTMNMLKKHTMITTEKTTRGMVITILNYEYYQNPENYDSYKAPYRKHTRNIQTADTILEEEEYKEERNKHILSSKPKKACSTPPPYQAIIDCLNEHTGKSFRADNKATKRLIQARFNDGFSIEDFRKVIQIKTMQWKTDPEMIGFLRPQTLFAGKFESYLNEHVQAEKRRKYDPTRF